jgi:hypothetical protein
VVAGPGRSIGDEADDDRSPMAPILVAMTTAIAMRPVDRGELLVVLVRCRSCLESSQRGVASTYEVFDMPTICSGP